MKKSELEAMYMAMAQVANVTVSPKFAYAIAKNRSKIEDEVKALQEARKPLAEFDKKRIDLCREMCDKDENGKPMTETKEIPGGKMTVFQGISGNEEYNKKLEELKEPYGEQFREVEELENKDCDEYKWHMIDLEQFPKEITSAVMMALMPLIREQDEKEDSEKEDAKDK